MHLRARSRILTFFNTPFLNSKLLHNKLQYENLGQERASEKNNRSKVIRCRHLRAFTITPSFFRRTMNEIEKGVGLSFIHRIMPLSFRLSDMEFRWILIYLFTNEVITSEQLNLCGCTWRMTTLFWMYVSREKHHVGLNVLPKLNIDCFPARCIKEKKGRKIARYDREIISR